jgi:Mn2+/Fe2+ NRAMP family transporter
MASSADTQHPAGTAGGPAAARPATLRRSAFTGYHWLLAIFLAAGCAQVFLAGLGVFSFGDHDVAGGTSAFDAHRALGWALGGVAIVIFVLALIARAGAARVALSGVLVVQTTVLQSLLAGLADNTALYGGLHALDGFVILGIAGGLYATSRRRP